ncbi:MAG: alpha/beta family hydrolase [Deltaproteobacteria bacterium]
MSELAIQVGERVGRVSALLERPPGARALYVLAHGAGAGMRHPFMQAVATGLAERGVATLRYQFPYVEAGGRRPDPPGVLEATVRAAVGRAAEAVPGLPLVAGGKSLGGRMTSSAAARAPLPGVRGLVFLGFPLHAPGKPGTERAGHLGRVQVPMLFLQGTRDALADLALMRGVAARLPGATFHVVEGGDHSFAVPKRSGRTEAAVMAELADTIVEWLGREGIA